MRERNTSEKACQAMGRKKKRTPEIDKKTTGVRDSCRHYRFLTPPPRALAACFFAMPTTRF
jgi:hypothetical protein